MDERERRLRQRFGPPAPGPPRQAAGAGRSLGPTRRRRWPFVTVGVVAALALAATGTYLAITPRQHVALGCWWWSARSVGQVATGQRGCVRGTYEEGGELAEGSSATDYRLPIAYSNPDQPVSRQPCPFAVGDRVVVRYHAVFDDGRTIVVVDDCR